MADNRNFPINVVNFLYLILIEPVGMFLGAGIAQSVWRLATGWMAEGSDFESR
jgi:hypothetical protein